MQVIGAIGIIVELLLLSFSGDQLHVDATAISSVVVDALRSDKYSWFEVLKRYPWRQLYSTGNTMVAFIVDVVACVIVVVTVIVVAAAGSCAVLSTLKSLVLSGTKLKQSAESQVTECAKYVVIDVVVRCRRRSCC